MLMSHHNVESNLHLLLKQEKRTTFFMQLGEIIGTRIQSTSQVRWIQFVSDAFRQLIF